MRAIVALAAALAGWSGVARGADAAPGVDAAPWHVAVIFAGGQEPADYQADIDENLIELTRLRPGPRLRLSIHRELPDRSVTYVVSPPGTPSGGVGVGRPRSPGPLFFRPDLATSPLLPLAGSLVVGPPTSSPILADPRRLRAFLGAAFPDPRARRLLVVYAHGQAYDGLRGVALTALRANLARAMPARGGGSAPPLDVLWLDSCYMASLEAAYELRGLAPYYVSSESSEFSAGLPFDALQALALGRTPAEASLELARRFLESYSYLRGGSQRRAVATSAATLSVIETARLEPLVAALGAMAAAAGRLAPEVRAELLRSAGRRDLDELYLTDLGRLLLAMAGNPRTPLPVREEARRALALLELGVGAERRGALVTNPRIALEPPSPGALAVFGYEGWRRGYQGDEAALAAIPPAMRPELFVPGPAGRSWPARPLADRAFVAPFAPGLNRLQVFFADPVTRRPLTPVASYARISDLAVFVAASPFNPVRLNGYTQAAGRAAERFTGLNVLDPLKDAASLDYLETEFVRRTGWAGL